ncbi:MAG TPA: alpha-ketoglutarate-dependent dioxygenase AlkB [Leptolyngbyaceae cyanobacterium]
MMLSPDETELGLEANLNSDAIQIPGLTYLPHYITVDEQNKLINIIDQQEWSTKLRRRVQHYGYRYDYKNGSLASSSYLGDLPDWAGRIAKRLLDDGLTTKVPDQVIINEYEPGQGITSHVDCVPCFGKTIISLSLGSSCVMDFTHSQIKQKASILLLPRSLVVMQGAARYEWQHSIAARKKDKYKGRELVRTRRVSMTFREVLFPYK